MLRYLALRALSTVVVLLGVSFLTFTLTIVIPGDPAAIIAGPKASPQVIQRVRQELGLDQPVLVQYARYLSKVLRGDLGRSYITREPVTRALRDRLPATVFLAITAWTLGAVAGVALGCSAILWPHAYRWVFALSFLGFSVPTFWLGLILLYVFAYRFPLFPLGGFSWSGVVLPACALGLGLMASYSRVVMSRLSEIMTQDFIRTAKAKGLTRSRIILWHALRHASLTVLTLLGLDLAGLLGGVTLTETVFNWPGLGRLAVESIFNQDIPTLMGTVLFTATVVVVVNFVVDASYAWLDPRVREEV